jgi:hypothetical protein
MNANITPEIISTKQVCHRAETQGEVIYQVQQIKVGTRIEEVYFWCNWSSGKLTRLTSRQIS